jgi:hypothetical protein
MVHGDFSDESSVIEVGHMAGNKGRICVFLCARHKIQISLQCRSPQPTAVKQQQLNNSNHGPVSKDLLFQIGL